MVGAWERVPGHSPLVIGICYSPVTPLTSEWLISLMNLDKISGTRVGFRRGVPIDVARNALVRYAQEHKAAYLFFLDADVIVPPDIVLRLMAWKVPIISGVYWSKRGYPAVWEQHPSGKGFTPMKVLPKRGLTEVAAIPMGAALIDMRTFACIPDPWFQWTIFDPRQEGEGKGLSEDLDFCRKASDHGFKLFVDPEIRCLHQSILPMTVEGEVELPPEQEGKE